MTRVYCKKWHLVRRWLCDCGYVYQTRKCEENRCHWRKLKLTPLLERETAWNWEYKPVPKWAIAEGAK